MLHCLLGALASRVGSSTVRGPCFLFSFDQYTYIALKNYDLQCPSGFSLTSDDYLPAALPTKEELSTRLQVASLVGRRWGAAHRDRRRRLVK